MSNDSRTNEIQSYLSKIQGVLDGLEQRPLVKGLVLESLREEIASLHYSIQRKLRTTTGKIFEDGLFDQPEDYIVQLITELGFSENEKETLESTLARWCYIWGYQQRFPKIFEEHIEPLLQMNLTNEVVVKDNEDRTFTLLGLYGHSYFLNRDPVVIRIMKPYQVGSENKGRNASVPQADLALFAYNSQEVALGTTRNAVVSIDGSSITTIDLEHNRVKLVEKEGLRKRALHNGVYESREVRLPVMGIMRFWQREFVTVLKDKRMMILQKGFDSQPEYLTQQQYDALLVEAMRFLGDRITPQQYWGSLQNFPAAKDFFNGPIFQALVADYSGKAKSLGYQALKLMTIL